MSSREWVSSHQLDVHVTWLLDQLEERKEALRLLLVGGVHADIFCYSLGADEQKPELPARTVARAHALGLEIEIDHYSDGDENDSQEQP